jgi:hypothetical protein
VTLCRTGANTELPDEEMQLAPSAEVTQVRLNDLAHLVLPYTLVLFVAD